MIRKCCLKSVDKISQRFDEVEDAILESEEDFSVLIQHVCSCGVLIRLLEEIENLVAEVWEKGSLNQADFEVLQRNGYFFMIEKGFKES